MILDIHTHHQNREKAIINASFCDFKPMQGLYYSLGLHPWDIDKKEPEAAIKAIETFASNSEQVLAIGECGVDSMISIPIKTQIEIFKRHIELSENLKKPLIIHCVRCSSEIIRLHKIYSPQQAWVIHGFRSNSNVLSNYLSETGIYISIGDKFNEEAVKIIPNDRLMLETDESTLSIEEIAERVAKVRSQSIQDVLNHIAQNNKTALFLE